MLDDTNTYNPENTDNATVSTETVDGTGNVQANSDASELNEMGDADTATSDNGMNLESIKSDEYMVLARKYRPMDFDSLIGQEALVRTLSNALKVGRVAQAFMLTGVRGVGKTTTARIIAKALNCDNVDENGNPPIKPCGTCSNCSDIAGDRHVDVLEMDAASNTGIDDIREIIESAKYAPSVGRYKIFILDEVHMLSKSAFNGLLKTLEEPPAHVKFIFATTEIRKVPVTVLSRCQRFDLRRVSVEQLFDHYKRIAGVEGYSVADDALRMISRSADGSVRDGLSILDQAIALSDGGEIGVESVANMLGLSDRQGIYDLYEHICRGEADFALKKVEDLYNTGADPVVITQDLLDVTWWLTRFKMTPSLKTDITTPEIEKNAGVALSDRLSTPALSRNWQILMKGLGEVQSSDRAMMTLEMVIVRLIFASELPTPEALVKKLIELRSSAPDRVSGGDNATQLKQQSISQVQPVTASKINDVQSNSLYTQATVSAEPKQDTETAVGEQETLQESVLEQSESLAPTDFKNFVDLLYKKSPVMAVRLKTSGRLVSFTPPKISLQLDDFKAEDMRELQNTVRRVFGNTWVIDRMESGGQSTIDEVNKQVAKARLDEADNLELVRSVRQYFPNAEIHKVENV